MDYRILYARRALRDLAEIIGVIADDNADTATRFGSAVLDHVELLSRFPRMGGVIHQENHPHSDTQVKQKRVNLDLHRTLPIEPADYE